MKNFPSALATYIDRLFEVVMIETGLRDSTLVLIKNRPVWMTFKLISEETTIPEGWLKMFSQGKIEDPSVNRIETLKNYLERTR